MPLSPEAIISIVGILVNIPSAAFIIWDLYKRSRAKQHLTLGTCFAPLILGSPTGFVLVIFPGLIRIIETYSTQKHARRDRNNHLSELVAVGVNVYV
jgi:hypothetical protein